MTEEGLRERKKRQVRERILEVCGELFRRRGYDETTIDEIAKRADISRQTFFNYFRGKDAVLAELGLAWLREQAEQPRLGQPGPSRSVFVGMQRVLKAQLEAVERDRDFMRLVVTRSGLFFPQGAHVGSTRDETRLDHMREFTRPLTLLLQAGQDAGQVRSDIPASQAAEMCVSVMLITLRLWLIDYWDEQESLVERGMRALRVLEDGLRVQDRTEPEDDA